MKTVVISAFPACGKTHMFENNEHLKILDSDSSEFSWIKDEYSKNTNERNPNFPQNYINHILDNIGESDIIFVSSHKVVRDALRENGIKYLLVYPNKSLKDIWINRFMLRENDVKFIDFISKNWENFIEDMENEKYPDRFEITRDSYMNDVFDSYLQVIE